MISRKTRPATCGRRGARGSLRARGKSARRGEHRACRAGRGATTAAVSQAVVGRDRERANKTDDIYRGTANCQVSDPLLSARPFSTSSRKRNFGPLPPTRGPVDDARTRRARGARGRRRGRRNARAVAESAARTRAAVRTRSARRREPARVASPRTSDGSRVRSATLVWRTGRKRICERGGL